MTLEGKDVHRLDGESGGHRVQRIPAQERQGRVHSSTVTVAVLRHRPAATPAARPPHEFVIQFYSGTGPGGQHRNKAQTSARIVHTPTGLVRTAQTRSRDTSVREAMQALEQALAVQARARQAQQERGIRQAQIGSGQRGDKRRTYRFQDNLVTDHLTGRRAATDRVLRGNFEVLWSKTERHSND